MPLASRSKVTSICGMPRGEGGIPSRWKRPSVRLSRAISRSPCRTWTSTEVWLSAAVEKTWERDVGMVVLRSISLVMTPPSVSTPRESGVTSSRRMSLTSPLSTPAWIAAPTATTSSGLTPLCGSLPPSRSLTSCWMIGVRVEPPTSTTSSICGGVRVASFNAARNGPRVRSGRSAVKDSDFARVKGISRCFGPGGSTRVDGRCVGVFSLLQTVGQGGGGRLVDDAQHVEVCDLAGVLGRLALRVVEVGGHGDDGVGHLLAQVRLGVGLQLLQDQSRNLFRRELFVGVRHDHDGPIVLARLDLIGHDLPLRIHLGELAAHEPLDRIDGVLGVDGRLAASQRAHQALTGLGEGDDGGRGARTFGVGDDDRLTAFHDGDDRVGRPQVDSYGFWHLSAVLQMGWI